MTDIYDALEACLQEIENGANVESVLLRYSDIADELRPLLEAAVEAAARGASGDLGAQGDQFLDAFGIDRDLRFAGVDVAALVLLERRVEQKSLKLRILFVMLQCAECERLEDSAIERISDDRQ